MYIYIYKYKATYILTSICPSSLKETSRLQEEVLFVVVKHLQRTRIQHFMLWDCLLFYFCLSLYSLTNIFYFNHSVFTLNTFLFYCKTISFIHPFFYHYYSIYIYIYIYIYMCVCVCVCVCNILYLQIVSSGFFHTIRIIVYWPSG